MNLYHLSENPDIKVLKPRIPRYACSHLEDTTTPRISFASSIHGCLSALQDLDMEFYVYVPRDDISIRDIIIPNFKQVIDGFINGEVWVLGDTPVICIGKIKSVAICPIDNDMKAEVVSRGGEIESVTFHKYHYEWIEKYSDFND